ncbi:MAG: hypothetical protein HUU21_18930 [Polyangiaceae bacterium]|nr:hypothetical protein [Polyangiaceae bacterium]
MKQSRAQKYRLSAPVSLGAGLLVLLAGCADAGGPDGPAPDALYPSEAPPLPEGTALVAEILARVSPSAKTITFEPIERDDPGLETQSIDELNLVQDETPGSGLRTTVELVTNSVGFDAECPAPYQAGTFCGNVTLSSFYQRSLANVFVQATSITPPSKYNAVNSDPSEFGQDDTFGLWKYTTPAATTAGVLGQAPHNSGTRDWVFANPDNGDWSMILRVISSLKYSAYIYDFSSASFIDACAGGSATTASSAQFTMPFPFTLYQSTNSIVRFNIRGVITFGNVNGTASGNNLALPSGNAPKPAVFAFWDNIQYGPAGKMCYKVVGAAPNRKVAITWNDMTFVDAPDAGTASLQFGVILSEGTNNIEMVYNSMNGASSRKSGDSATVGVQNEDSTSAMAEFNLGIFSSGSAYAFIPIP